MMRRIGLVVYVIVSCCVIPAAAQGHWRELGDVTRVEKLANGVMLTAGSGRVSVTVVNGDGTVRVRAIGSGAFGRDGSWAVVPQSAQNPAVTINDQHDAVELTTAAGRVRIEKRPLRIVFLDSAGQPILQDDAKRPIVFNGGEFRDWKSMPADEHYYGLGDKAGSFDHRDHAYLMWNTDAYFWQEASDPLYKDIPFFMGLRKGRAWGVFLDNTWRTNFEFGKESRDTFSFGADGGELNYYFFWGPSPKDVVRQYTALTGRTPLPPLFA